ncbi:peptidoglycan-binding domain-containing protein [Streptomyces sp. NEAU-W12]|uniref:peptidoglycan-binding domain-containing protein n=1 Tax=Streptomyces sp. NEAU-W12 TaxID=2994668 RepID=UPI00224AF357|nr:peptidoglycan-binding domain-containing protein [Streptomyces sp. NEAU-W12]MCX2927055.1 peptidoglycan-binding domain-containing protein [Streptomyces sp. NEAU-W12]
MTIRTARPRLAVAAVLGTTLGAVLAVGTLPASAAVSDGYVSGSGSFRNDWSDETVHADYYPRSNAACLWQKILWAEGLLADSEVDGAFGSRTVARTRSLQSRWGTPATGKADNFTFTRAAGRLAFVSGTIASGKRLELKYNGAAHDFTVRRDERGRHGSHLDGGWKAAAYKQRTCV